MDHIFATQPWDDFVRPQSLKGAACFLLCDVRASVPSAMVCGSASSKWADLACLDYLHSLYDITEKRGSSPQIGGHGPNSRAFRYSLRFVLFFQRALSRSDDNPMYGNSSLLELCLCVETIC